MNLRSIALIHSKSVLHHPNVKPHQLLVTGVLTKLEDEVKLISAVSLDIHLDVILLNHIPIEDPINRTQGRYLQTLTNSSWQLTSRSHFKANLRP